MKLPSGSLSTGWLGFEAAVLPARPGSCQHDSLLEILRSSGSTKGGTRQGRSAASEGGVEAGRRAGVGLMQMGLILQQ